MGRLMSKAEPLSLRGYSPRFCSDCRQAPSASATAAAIPYRCLDSLTIPRSCPRTACAQWGALQLTARARAELERAFREVIRARVRAALLRLEPHIAQRALARRLGLSLGYLSNLKAGRCTPSPALVSVLAILASDPLPRLRDLDRYLGERNDG